MHFKLKKEAEFAKKVINLKDELELLDSPIKVCTEWNLNPLNEMSSDVSIEKTEKICYFDSNQVLYRKDFLDIYYEEIK
jgi:hypothetical protein